MSLNRVMLIGNLGADPELRYTPSGSAVVAFNIATTKKFKDRDGNKQTKTVWHKIIAWRQLADICSKYLKKGQQIYVEGEIETRDYQDRDGNKRYVTEIIISEMQMLGNSRNSEQSSSNHHQDSRPDGYHQENLNYDDELPF